ncbi:hypothetical protein [Mycobacterium sp.]|uniref:hypothetical protein n=1 Tax=Mycobacterium sp. TaxID=1785 RepID=UPI002DA9E354|nr:hypothetical protein [Mycobacterium sp.]
MGRAEMLLAACAITMALLAGATTAVASADTGDSPASDSTSDTASDVGPDKTAENTVADTYSGDADRTAGEPGDVGENTVGTKESEDEQGDEQPIDDESGNDNCDGGTVNRLPPMLIPEAPPVADLAPPPAELPPLPQELPPVPADVPPGEPDPVIVTVAGPIASLPDGNGSPVMRMPIILAPTAAPPGLGASIAARGTLGPIITSTPRWAGEQAPSPRHAPASDPRLREVTTSSGIAGKPGQAPQRTGYNNEAMPRVRLSEMAAGALPGIAGMMAMTAAGVCLGHRQAMAAHQLQTRGLDRFLA